VFTFNSITSDSMGLTVTDIRRALAPGIDVHLQAVATMHGAYTYGSRISERAIEVDVHYDGTSLADARTDTHALATWLYTTSPVPLVFDDEPALIYYAMLSSDSDLTAIGAHRNGTLRFLCPDPFAYEDTAVSTAVTEGETTVTNNGGFECYPTFTVDIDAPSTSLIFENVSTQQGLQVGIPLDLSATIGTPVEAWTLDWFDDCSEMDWTPTTMNTANPKFYSTLDTDPTNPMEMGTDGVYFSHQVGDGDPGEGDAWHGPSVYRSATTPIENFRVDAHVANKTFTRSGDGLLAVTLRDAMDNDLACLFAMVISTGVGYPYPQFGAWMGEQMVNATWTAGFQGKNYDYGHWDLEMDDTHMQITRINDVWEFHVWSAARPTNDTITFTYVDTDGTFGANLDKVVISTMDLYTYGTVDYVLFYGVTLESMPSQDLIYCFDTGDQIQVDMAAGAVTLNNGPYSNVSGYNGQRIPMNALLDVNSQFWALQPGDNLLSVYADTGVNVTGYCVHKERWL